MFCVFTYSRNMFQYVTAEKMSQIHTKRKAANLVTLLWGVRSEMVSTNSSTDLGQNFKENVSGQRTQNTRLAIGQWVPLGLGTTNCQRMQSLLLHGWARPRFVRINNNQVAGEPTGLKEWQAWSEGSLCHTLTMDSKSSGAFFFCGLNTQKSKRMGGEGIHTTPC